VIPTLRIPAKRRAGPFQNQPCLLFHLFYQVQIRLGSPQVEELWAGLDDSDNKASIISHGHGDNSRIIGNRRR
jgi:hypothetical protein